MNILIYTNGDDPQTNERIHSVVTSKVSFGHVESFHNLEDLSVRVHRLPKEIDVAILLAYDFDQLCELVTLREFLENIPIILILPNLEKKTISKATKLYPSYTSSMDSDFADVSAVLGKILKLRDKKPSISLESVGNPQPRML